MLCLSDYIGLRDCGVEVPESGLWVNDLPGISTELAEKSANREQVNFLGVWRSVQAGAFQRLKTDVVAAMNKRVNFNTTLYQTERPVLVKPFVWRAEAIGSRGGILRSPSSRYSEIVIRSLYVFAKIAVETTVTVIDLQTQAVLATEPVTLAAGFNAILLKEPVRVALATGKQEVYVSLEAVEGLELAEFDPHRLPLTSPHHRNRNCDCEDEDDLAAYFARLDSDLVALPNAGKPTLWVDAAFTCSLEAFICEHREQLATPLWYSLGEKLLAFKLLSPRLNVFTTSLLEQTESTAKSYYAEYQKTLEQTLKVLPLAGSGFCFDCKETRFVEYGGSMP